MKQVTIYRSDAGLDFENPLDAAKDDLRAALQSELVKRQDSMTPMEIVNILASNPDRFFMLMGAILDAKKAEQPLSTVTASEAAQTTFALKFEQGEVTNYDIVTLPLECRERLRLEGRPHPKSGCSVCKTGGVMGCPAIAKAYAGSVTQTTTVGVNSPKVHYGSEAGPEAIVPLPPSAWTSASTKPPA